MEKSVYLFKILLCLLIGLKTKSLAFISAFISLDNVECSTTLVSSIT